MATSLRKTLGEPLLTLDPAYTAPDIAGDPYEYPAEENVRWDIGMGCMVMVEHDTERVMDHLAIRIAVGPDFPIKTGRELRTISTDQLRQFACQLIALAEHVDRQREAS